MPNDRNHQTVAMEFGNTRLFPNSGSLIFALCSCARMSNSERLHSLLSGSKLRLSVEDAIALALENNLDISVARYNLNFAQTDLVRAKSGGATRGVPGAFSSSALFSGAIGGASVVSAAAAHERQRSDGQWGRYERRRNRLLRSSRRSPVRLDRRSSPSIIL